MNAISGNDCPTRRRIVTVLCLALVVRTAMVVLQFENLRDDPDGYFEYAGNLILHGVYGPDDPVSGAIPSAYRPPLYPFLLAGCIRSELPPQMAIAAMHVFLGVATVGIVIMLGRACGLGVGALSAALWIAFDPILLNQSTLIMTETLATLLAAMALYATVQWDRRSSARQAALCGAAWALATLCRPIFCLMILMIAVVWLARRGIGRRRYALVLAHLAVAGAVMLPWTVRNFYVFGRPILLTTHGGYTLLLGNNPSFYNYLAGGRWGTTWDSTSFLNELREQQAKSTTRQSAELVLDGHYHELARENIRKQPGRFAYACLIRIGRLWQLVPHRRDVVESAAVRLSRYGVGLWYLIEFTLALIGAWALGRRLAAPPWLWGILLCGGFTVAHSVYWSNMRMRAPLMPVIALLAAMGLAVVFSRRAVAADSG